MIGGALVVSSIGAIVHVLNSVVMINGSVVPIAAFPLPAWLNIAVGRAPSPATDA